MPGSLRHAAIVIGLSVSRVLLAGGGAATQAGEGHTQIVLLGTGNPSPTPDKSGPSTAIVVNNEPYLVDFGPASFAERLRHSKKASPRFDPPTSTTHL